MQEIQNENEVYRNKATRLHQSQGNVDGIVNRIRAGQPRNCGSILGRGRRLFSSRKRPTQPSIQRRLFPRE
jgi:hypothetical protein